MATRAETRALTRLAASDLAAVPRGIGDVHAAVAGRVFGTLGGAAAPVRLVHDAITRGVYTGVSGGLWLGARAAGAAAPANETPLGETPRGAMALAALNGLYGDRLEPPLAIPMQLRRAGGPLTGHVAVFVHGLGETEHAWGNGYGRRLAEELGVTPVFVRFNTGRAIADNGAKLAELLDRELAGAERITLIGHSMGGLLARSATSHGGAWTRRVGHVITLGTPHTGAPLEQAVHAMGAALALTPETRPFARLLGRRSAGIRDLRRGLDIPPLAGARHCAVAATVTRSERHVVGRVVGDTLVLAASARGDATDILPVGGAHHLALLNHPEVYTQLRRWLAAPA